MQFIHLSLLALASSVFAQDNSNDTQSLNATLSGNDQLSNLTSFLSIDPRLLETLSQANNITILAPSNDAFTEFASTDTGRDVASNPGLLAALLQYHVLNGTFQSSQVSNTSTFIPTLLTNETYANVTGGQVVEAIQVGNETVFYSGLLQNTTVTTAVGSLLHLNAMKSLTIPGPKLHWRCNSHRGSRVDFACLCPRHRQCRQLDITSWSRQRY